MLGITYFDIFFILILKHIEKLVLLGDNISFILINSSYGCAGNYVGNDSR